jgi:hypothetical protein
MRGPRWFDGVLVGMIVPVLLACGLLAPYAPGKLTAPGDISEDAVRRGSCIDLGVALAGRGEVSPLQMLVRFGNRCPEAARIDLARVRIEATVKDQTQTLYLDDPRGEVVPMHLETEAMGTERFKLGPMVSFRPTRVCVFVDGAIDRMSELAPICFQPSEGNAWEVIR